jgi:hypothetical protein
MPLNRKRTVACRKMKQLVGGMSSAAKQEFD